MKLFQGNFVYTFPDRSMTVLDAPAQMVSATAALDLAEGGYYTFTGIIGSWKLRPLAGNTSVRYIVMNEGTGALNIVTNMGGNDINSGGMKTSTVVINPGECAVLYNNSVSWFKQL